MKIGVISLNPAIDRTQYLEHFHAGGVFRSKTTVSYPAGKGTNVARYLKMLGSRPEMLGFLGGSTGRYMQDILRQEHIPVRAVRIKEASRIAAVIVDTHSRTQTVINEQGPVISRRELNACIQLYKKFIAGKSYITISGSIPLGVASDIYARFIAIARSKRVPVLLDTTRSELRKGYACKPAILKLNRSEFEWLSNRPLRSSSRLCDAIRRTNRRGIETVIITLGADGALIGYQDRIWHAVPPGVRVQNAVSSGDAVTAGFISLWASGRQTHPAEALKFAVACGSASVLHAGTGYLTKGDVARICRRVRIKEL